MEKRSLHNAAILFRLILIVGCIALSCRFSSAEADNRYCEPGNGVKFGVVRDDATQEANVLASFAGFFAPKSAFVQCAAFSLGSTWAESRYFLILFRL